MSYVHLDDQHEGGRISEFRQRLSAEVRMQTGAEFSIFQDRNDIAWGQNWHSRIEEGLDAVTLLIPIITPSFFRSSHCRDEVSRFLQRERQLGRGDLILPVYYISTPEMDDPTKRDADELATLLAARQYADWRELRFEPLSAPVVRRALAQLANRLRDSLWPQAPSVSHSDRSASLREAATNTADSPQGTKTRTPSVARSEPPTHGPASYHRGDYSTSNAAIVRAEAFVAGATPYLEQFYEGFVDRVASAKSSIYLSGQGFDCTSDGGKRHALALATATDKALRRGIPVVRLQTHTNIDSGWMQHLSDLLTRHPQTFELYAIKDPRTFQMASICAIDAESVDHCTAEFMLQLRQFYGTSTRGVAGTAVLVDGHQALAQAIRDQLLDTVRNDRYAVKIESAKQAQTFFKGEYYFAYGSNMCREQMVKRCPTAISAKPALLDNHRLVFNRRGSYRPGSVAGVEPCPGERVYGLVWRVREEEFRKLDEAEDPDAYTRERMTVHALDGDPIECYVYRSRSKEDQSLDPDIMYLRDLAECAKAAKLPPEYVEKLWVMAAQANPGRAVPGDG